MAGQVKSVKPCLKQLQQSIQTIMQPTWPSDEVVSGPNVGDMFVWMPKEHLYVLVYLVTVMHSMQAGYMEKAQKYTDKALTQIEKLKSKFNPTVINISLTFPCFQSLTTNPYCLCFNSCCWSTSSCAGSSWGTKALLYKRSPKRAPFATNIPDCSLRTVPNFTPCWDSMR